MTLLITAKMERIPVNKISASSAGCKEKVAGGRRYKVLQILTEEGMKSAITAVCSRSTSERKALQTPYVAGSTLQQRLKGRWEVKQKSGRESVLKVTMRRNWLILPAITHSREWDSASVSLRNKLMILWKRGRKLSRASCKVTNSEDHSKSIMDSRQCGTMETGRNDDDKTSPTEHRICYAVLWRTCQSSSWMSFTAVYYLEHGRECN